VCVYVYIYHSYEFHTFNQAPFVNSSLYLLALTVP
jgi:hypothetical protein